VIADGCLSRSRLTAIKPSLSLARAASQQKEIAIRAALGARRGRIVRQLLTESALLALAGGSLGLGLAVWAVGRLKTLPGVTLDSLLRNQGIGIDGWTLGFTIALSLLVGLIFGLAPALQASKPSLTEELKEGGRVSSGGLVRHRVRQLLVVAEVALALVLVTGAGLLVRSFALLRNVDPGFDARRVLTMWIALPPAKYPLHQNIASFHRQLLERVETLPGVQFAGVSSGPPMSGARTTWGFITEDRPNPQPEDIWEADYCVVSPNYLRALGIPLIQGRAFEERDHMAAPGVVLINETMAPPFLAERKPGGAAPETRQPGRGAHLGRTMA
jgi:putative ABC transport system permease protein